MLCSFAGPYQKYLLLNELGAASPVSEAAKCAK